VLGRPVDVEGDVVVVAYARLVVAEAADRVRVSAGVLGVAARGQLAVGPVPDDDVVLLEERTDVHLRQAVADAVHDLRIGVMRRVYAVDLDTDDARIGDTGEHGLPRLAHVADAGERHDRLVHHHLHDRLVDGGAAGRALVEALDHVARVERGGKPAVQRGEQPGSCDETERACADVLEKIAP
jgi:hypothetical protein